MTVSMSAASTSSIWSSWSTSTSRWVVWDSAAHTTSGLGHLAQLGQQDREMVVFSHHRIGQRETVVVAPAATDGVTLQGA